MSTVKEAIEGRRSIRKYKPDPVPDESLLQILEAARLAPSGSNTQPWRFIVVKGEETRKKLKEAAFNQRFVGQAPVVIVCCGDLTCWRQLSKRATDLTPVMEEWGLKDVTSRMTATVRNVAIAVEHMVLQAEELGLGTCWVGLIDRKKVREMLKIPDHLVIVSLLPIGYPAEDPGQRPRFGLYDIAFSEDYGRSFEV
ncbi:MAG: nitroreductase family protein [Halobacteriota archaeon]|nr:nitroreductase family protein [Halobacteriota archaeon]